MSQPRRNKFWGDSGGVRRLQPDDEKQSQRIRYPQRGQHPDSLSERRAGEREP